MIIDERKSKGERTIAPNRVLRSGFTAVALPEIETPDLAEKSKSGVSTRNGSLIEYNDKLHGQKEQSKPNILNVSKPFRMTYQAPAKHWYALRTTYGREKKAYSYILSKGGTAYYPTIMVDKLVDGRIRSVEVSRIPNIFFAYGTEKEIKAFVYDNLHLPFLRFYYRYYNPSSRENIAIKSNVPNVLAKEPLIIPDRQMETLRIVCEAESKDTIVTSEPIHKFEKGEQVRVIDGQFKGAVGVVARFKGQQRVGIVIDGVVTAITAYVPSAMMEKI